MQRGKKGEASKDRYIRTTIDDFENNATYQAKRLKDLVQHYDELKGERDAIDADMEGVKEDVRKIIHESGEELRVENKKRTGERFLRVGEHNISEWNDVYVGRGFKSRGDKEIQQETVDRIIEIADRTGETGLRARKVWDVQEFENSLKNAYYYGSNVKFKEEIKKMLVEGGDISINSRIVISKPKRERGA